MDKVVMHCTKFAVETRHPNAALKLNMKIRRERYGSVKFIHGEGEAEGKTTESEASVPLFSLCG